MRSPSIEILLTKAAILARLITHPTTREFLKDVWYRNRHEARMGRLEYERARRRKS
jgi:hypothetical protein